MIWRLRNFRSQKKCPFTAGRTAQGLHQSKEIMATNYGFVYILGNAAMPGIYKLGMTTRSPRERAAELSGATAVPVPFVVLAYGECTDFREAEQWMHSEGIGEFRISDSREFFFVPISHVICRLIDWIPDAVVTRNGGELLVQELIEAGTAPNMHCSLARSFSRVSVEYANEIHHFHKIDVHRSFDVLSDPDLSAIQQSARMRELMHSHEEAF